MKTEWKWNFAAQLGLVVIIALTAFFIASAFVFVVPVVVESHVDLGISAPDYLITLINIAYLIQQTAWIWLIALAGGLILFEWKCRSENKALIRTAIGVGASLVSLAIAFWIAAAIVIPLVQVRHATIDQQQESVVMAKIIEAHESYKQLAQAIEDENWPVADESATEVRDAYRFLRDMPTTTAVLAGENQLGSPGEIRRLTTEIADFSDDLHDSIRDNRAPPITLEYFSQLKKSYAQLATESTFFTTHLEPEARQEVTEEGTSETGSTHAPKPRNMPK